MSNKDVEKIFKFIFGLAVVVAGFVVIGLFLLIIKVLLNFFPEISILGVTMIN
ncbi:MAG: hypothetical protein WC415_01150 [Patescibacteria group bacterium]|jgi:hypothetical protein